MYIKNIMKGVNNMKLVVGLGNPGAEYEKTRHNVGYSFLDYVTNNACFSENKKFNAFEYEASIDGEKILFIKPTTYMNLSGEAVLKYVNYYKIDFDDILVIQDDLDMNFGKIRIVYDSSSGGHNGIKNISDCLGSQKYTRLKIGISNDKNMDTKDYVLGKFSKDDLNCLEHIYSKLDNIINDFVNMNTDELKQKYNSMNNN